MELYGVYEFHMETSWSAAMDVHILLVILDMKPG